MTTSAIILWTVVLVAAAGLGAWLRWSLRQRRLSGEHEAALAVTAERGRIARDLHDVVVRSVTLMGLQAGAAARLVRSDPVRAEATLVQVDETGRQAVVELQRFLRLLHPDPDDLTAPSGVEAREGSPDARRAPGGPGAPAPSGPVPGPAVRPGRRSPVTPGPGTVTGLGPGTGLRPGPVMKPEMKPVTRPAARPAAGPVAGAARPVTGPGPVAGPAERDPGTTALPPGLQDVTDLVVRARAAGLAVEVSVAGRPGELDPGVDLTAYRVVQEALTNAVRHADREHPAQVVVEWGPDDVRITVGNRFRGGRKRPPVPGHGIVGMRERVRNCRGSISIGPRPDGRFVVDVSLPAVRRSSASAPCP